MRVQGKVWGETRKLFNTNNVEVHAIHIKKGGYCSKHHHLHKYNKFIIQGGELKVSVYGSDGQADVTLLKRGDEYTVPPGAPHRFEAVQETVALEIYWVSLNEHDIIREDKGGVRETTANTGCENPRGRIEENFRDGRQARPAFGYDEDRYTLIRGAQGKVAEIKDFQEAQ